MAQNPFNTDLDRNPANHQPLTPLTFLERAASVFPDHVAIVHGPLQRSYASFYAEGQTADTEALRAWCRSHLAGYKVRGTYVFTNIPRTSTGKIQKFVQRERAAAFATEADNPNSQPQGREA